MVVIGFLGLAMMVVGFVYGRVRFKSFEERLSGSVRKDYKQPTAKEKALLIGLMFGGILLMVTGFFWGK